MSFGTELQSRSAHEALIATQDAEIHVLETIKKSITQRIKCDRDYAVALSAIVTGAQKQDTTSSGLQTHMVRPSIYCVLIYYVCIFVAGWPVPANYYTWCSFCVFYRLPDNWCM